MAVAPMKRRVAWFPPRFTGADPLPTKVVVEVDAESPLEAYRIVRQLLGPREAISVEDWPEFDEAKFEAVLRGDDL
jgi:hypothetical protein